MRTIPFAAIFFAALLGLFLTADASAQGLFGNSNQASGGSITAGTRTAVSGLSAGATTEGNTGIDVTGAAGAIGQADSSDRYLRENRQGAFVGASATDVQQAFIGSLQAGEGANFRVPTNLGGGGQRGGRMNQPGGGRGGRSTTIRTSLHVAFAHPTIAGAAASTALTDRLVRLAKIQSTAGMRVEVQNGTAILRGVVATQRDREMAEQLARLEAGIWSVKNELTVAQAPVDQGAVTPAPSIAVPANSPPPDPAPSIAVPANSPPPVPAPAPVDVPRKPDAP